MENDLLVLKDLLVALEFALLFRDFMVLLKELLILDLLLREILEFIRLCEI